jgi:hypothetical protein
METLREYLKNFNNNSYANGIKEFIIDLGMVGETKRIENTLFGIDSFIGGSGVKVDDYLVTMEHRGKLGQENVQIVQCVKKFIVKTSLEDFGYIFMSDESAYDSFEMINADIDYHRQQLEEIYDKLENEPELQYALGDVMNILDMLEFRKWRK